jgi:hypothetical protein
MIKTVFHFVTLDIHLTVPTSLFHNASFKHPDENNNFVVVYVGSQNLIFSGMYCLLACPLPITLSVVSWSIVTVHETKKKSEKSMKPKKISGFPLSARSHVNYLLSTSLVTHLSALCAVRIHKDFQKDD